MHAETALGGRDQRIFEINFQCGGHLEDYIVGLSVGQVSFRDDRDDF